MPGHTDFRPTAAPNIRSMLDRCGDALHGRERVRSVSPTSDVAKCPFAAGSSCSFRLRAAPTVLSLSFDRPGIRSPLAGRPRVPIEMASLRQIPAVRLGPNQPGEPSSWRRTRP